MNQDLLTTLIQRLDEPSARYGLLDAYYAGTQPLTFLAPDAKKALRDRLSTVSVNIPKVVVDTLVERLRLTGFSDPKVWADWLANDLDQLSAVAHREALILGRAYVMVWADQTGAPRVTVESARQVAVQIDPGTRRIVAGIKKWETTTTTEAVVFEADQITRLSANHLGAVSGFVTVETIANPLGVPPLVCLANSTRLLDDGISEMDTVLSLSDAVVKLTTDMLVASEFGARPRRWGTGIELEEDADGNAVNPFDESDRMMLSEEAVAKFGQLPGSDLAGYQSALNVLMRQISTVTGLPEHMLGIGGDNPTSADSIRASEAALTAKAESRAQIFGRGWEDVARLIRAVRTRQNPNRIDVKVQWADPSTRSVAQEADAVTKLFTVGLLPAAYALKRLGYTDTEITEITTISTTAAARPSVTTGEDTAA